MGIIKVDSAALAERRASSARGLRAELLAQCDWTALPDAPLGAVERAAWAEYRQALRDVTSQLDFPDRIDWPEKP